MSAVSGDVAERGDAERIVAHGVHRYCQMDISVNSAGINPRAVDPTADFDVHWEAMQRINANDTLLMSDAP